MNLAEFVIHHTNPASGADPSVRSANVVFFHVILVGDPKASKLTELIQSYPGEFCQCNPLDGAEHNFLELGGWIGDQGLALRLMGLGRVLDLWTLITPFTLGLAEPHEITAARALAGAGLLSIRCFPSANLKPEPCIK